MSTRATVLDSAAQLRQRARAASRLSQSEERRIVARAKTGDAGALNTLAEAHLPLLLSLARRHAAVDALEVDLAQEGALGLLSAVEQFDPALGHRFNTFARPRIEGTMKRYIENHGSMIRVPFQNTVKRDAVETLVRRFRATIHRDPSPPELWACWEALGGTVANTAADGRRATLVSRRDLQVILDPPRAELGLMLFDQDSGDEDLVTSLSRAEQRKLVLRLVDQLPPEDRRLVARRFGLQGDAGAQLSEVSRELSLTPLEVRRRERRILNRLRAEIEAQTEIAAQATRSQAVVGAEDPWSALGALAPTTGRNGRSTAKSSTRLPDEPEPDDAAARSPTHDTAGRSSTAPSARRARQDPRTHRARLERRRSQRQEGNAVLPAVRRAAHPPIPADRAGFVVRAPDAGRGSD